MCAYVCVLAGEGGDPWGEQIDGIMHVLNIITMQYLDRISGDIQALMGLSNGSGVWDWTHTHTLEHAHTLPMRS